MRNLKGSKRTRIVNVHHFLCLAVGLYYDLQKSVKKYSFEFNGRIIVVLFDTTMQFSLMVVSHKI